mgnify:CR=1 FL=1
MNNEALLIVGAPCNEAEKILTFIQTKTKGLKGEEHEILDTFPILYIRNDEGQICKELAPYIAEELTFDNGLNQAEQSYEEILELLDKNYAITNRVLCKEFGYDEADQAEFAQLSKNKFCDRTIVDTVARNAREPHRKLGGTERVIGPMKLISNYGEDSSILEMTAAAMLLYDNEGEDKWREIKKQNTPEDILENICGLDRGCKLAKNIMKYYREFSA